MGFWVCERPTIAIPDTPEYTIANSGFVVGTTPIKIFENNQNALLRGVFNFDLRSYIYLGWRDATIAPGEGMAIPPSSGYKFEILELNEFWMRSECWVVADLVGTKFSVIEISMTE